MKNRWVSIVVVAALLAVAGGRELRAAVIFDNLPPTASSNGLQPTSGTLIAQQFSTDASTYALSGVTLWMQTVLAGTPSVDLYSDDGSGTEPGSLLASFTPLATVPGPLGPTAFTISGYPLAASTDYWIVLSQTLGGGGSYRWSFTNSSANLGVGASTNNALDIGAGWTPYASDPFQMKVFADPPPPPAVPEPSTFLLMGGLMMGAFTYRRRRASRN